MLPVALLNITAGCRCLDACAAPGGKTAQMLCSLAKASRVLKSGLRSGEMHEKCMETA